MMNRTPPRRSPRFVTEPNANATGEDDAVLSASNADAARSENTSQESQCDDEYASQAIRSQEQIVTGNVSEINSESKPTSQNESSVTRMLQEKILTLENTIQDLLGKLAECEPTNAISLSKPGAPEPVHAATGALAMACNSVVSTPATSQYADYAIVPCTLADSNAAIWNANRAAISSVEMVSGMHEAASSAAAYSAVAKLPVAMPTAAPLLEPPFSDACLASATSAVAASATAYSTYASVCAAIPAATPAARSPFYVASGSCQPSNAIQPPVRMTAVRTTFSTTTPFSRPTTTPNVWGQYIQPSTNSTAITSNTVMTPRKLQDLPEFSGQPEDWPIFSTAFEQSTIVYGYSNFENNLRLQKSLKGEARDTVKSLLIHPDNVNVLMEQLRFRFGRPELLIYSQLALMKEVVPITENSIGKIVPFAVKVRNLTAFLQSVNAHQHLSNPTLLEELIGKLPMSKRIDWARASLTVQPFVTIVHFSDWLTQMANLICTVQGAEVRDLKRRAVLHAAERPSATEEEKPPGGTPEKQDAPSIKCPICSRQHRSVQCEQFIEASVADKWKLAKRHRLCFTCLKTGHATRNCRGRKPCLKEGCQMMHHKLLHDEASVQPTKTSQEGNLFAQSTKKQSGSAELSQSSSMEKSDAINGSILSCAQNSSERKLLFRILPVTVYNMRKSVTTYALLDEGSSVTLIDSSLVQELGLRGRESTLNVQWLGGRAMQEPTTVVDLTLCGSGIKKKHQLRNVYSIVNLDLPTQTLSASDINASSCEHLPLKPYSGAVPKLLIGLDNCHLGLPSDVMKISAKGPYAANTELGWTVFGPTAGTEQIPKQCLFVSQASDQTLHDMVAHYFEVENFGVKPCQPIDSSADNRAKSILQSTTRRVKGRYETGLLWKSDSVRLPDSYGMALRRLKGLEKKMLRDEAFSVAYKNIVNSYVERGYARKLRPEEIIVTGDRTWYLPHFGIVNPNKPSKLRLVFDAAAEVDGVSLNSQLLKGPQEYRALPSILFHFREGAVAVCSDIKEMFHQVVIRQEDRSAQRFLWRNGCNIQEPEIYEMQVMTFGAACSPCAADFVKKKNALEQQDSASARAVKAIIDYHYVDDFVDSFETTKEAIDISQQVREIHKNAGFELRNFTSNSKEVLRRLGGEDTNISIRSKESLAEEKVLGMHWQPSEDIFKFSLKFHNVGEAVINGERRPTKRELLSVIMSIFDPLGFLSYVTIAAKLIMREVWKRKINWDETLPDDINLVWERWRQLIPTATDLRIPRFYFSIGGPKQLQLHIFVDASEDAFAATAYWRIENAAGEIGLALICAKAKCAPLKILTVPRLELQAAVLGTRLLQTIREEHSVVPSKFVLWSDSKTVLRWMRSEHRRYKPFVAHRVAEIMAASAPSNWRWVPTAENVADDATRLKAYLNNRLTTRWLHGPMFLLGDEQSWPDDSSSCDNELEDEEELRSRFALIAVSRNPLIFERFSSFYRLLRTMAWIIRFVSLCRRQISRNGCKYGLTSSELDDAKVWLCRFAQSEEYQSELRELKEGRSVHRASNLLKLTPYLDDAGVMRVQGRIDAASWLPINTRRPVILPPNHTLTKLIVAHHHAALKHQNEEATISEIRRQFWIPRLRHVLRSVISKCFVCRVNKSKPKPPIMGPLPEDRLTPYVRPFSYTGLDYFGPVTVAVGRRQEKRWVALFTCLSIRAIHLELAHDLSTDACIIAIRNFVNRRGTPVRLRSDNGKNFVGADREAKRFAEVFDCSRVQDELSTKGIEWRFNCPLNPSEGGVWERMVQCVKRVLRVTLKEVAPREHVLNCFLIEAENVVNSRPLTHIPVTSEQEEPLTPNHFLLGTANTAQTPCDPVEIRKLCTLRKQWRIARQLRDHFWKRWIAEYLPTLTRRAKWCEHTESLKVGDVVFVCDSAVPRRQWCRGIVERIYTGADDVARQADVRTSSGSVMRRAASKLAVLNVDNSESGCLTGGGVSQKQP